MYKPSLKRSKQSHESLFSTQASQVKSESTTKDKLMIQQKFQNPDLYIPSLFIKNQLKQVPDSEPRIVSPLNCWNLQYPSEIKQKLSRPIGNIKSRLIGSKFGVYWLITENQLYVWRYKSLKIPNQLHICRKIEFQQNIRALAMGHINKDECQIMIGDNCQTVAIGFQHVIDLYTINLETLDLAPMKIRLRVQLKQTLQKLEITDSNQILYTGDQGYLTRVAFDSNDVFSFPKVQKCNAKPSFFSLNSIRSSLQLTRANLRIFTQKILRTPNKIYVLIRKQSQRSFLYKFGVSALKFLSGRLWTDEQQNHVQKQIHVYTIVDRKNNKIQFNGVIRNRQIQRKIKESYSGNQGINRLDPSQDNLMQEASEKANVDEDCTILSIFNYQKKIGEQTQNVDKFSIITTYGLIITMKQTTKQAGPNYQNIFFDEVPRALPVQMFQPTQKSSVNALFFKGDNLKTKSQPQNANSLAPLIDGPFSLVYSLGENNLNLTSNGLCFYFDQKEIQIAKLDKYPGYIVQSFSCEDNFNQGNVDKMWIVFAKENITVIRRCQFSDYLISIMNALTDYEMQAKANKQKLEQYEYQIHAAMHQISNIIGQDRLCKQLCKLILMTNKQKIMQNPRQNKKGQIFYHINSQMRELAKEQQKQNAKIRTVNRLKNANLLFLRWLLPKRKDIKLEQLPITEQLQTNLWKYFTLFSIENDDQNKTIAIPVYHQPLAAVDSNQKKLKSLPAFAYLIIQIFNRQYYKIKDMNLTEIRRSPKKIKQIKKNLYALLRLLTERDHKQGNILQNFIYLGKQHKNFQKRIEEQNKTKDSISNIQLINKNPVEDTLNDQNMEAQQNNQIIPIANWQLVDQNNDTSTEEIARYLKKIIPRLDKIIELYELLAANSQRKYQDIPTIEKFVENFTARMEVKAALIDLFSSTDIATNEKILKFNKQLPELRLQADILLSKWIKFIYRAYNTQQIKWAYENRQFAQLYLQNRGVVAQRKNNLLGAKQLSQNLGIPASVSQQIRLSDLQQLSKQLQFEQIAKIRHLFHRNPELYLETIIRMFQFRKMHYRVVNDVMEVKICQQQQMANNQKYGTSSAFLPPSIFVTDKNKANIQWRQWLRQEIRQLKAEIQTYLCQLSINLNTSIPKLYLEKEAQFDKCTKTVLENCSQATEIMKQVILFMQENKLVPDKIYRLSVAIDPTAKSRSIIASLLHNQTRPEFMSSFQLLKSYNRRSRDEIFEDIQANINRSKNKSVQNTGPNASNAGRMASTAVPLPSMNVTTNLNKY